MILRHHPQWEVRLGRNCRPALLNSLAFPQLCEGSHPRGHNMSELPIQAELGWGVEWGSTVTLCARQQGILGPALLPSPSIPHHHHSCSGCTLSMLRVSWDGFPPSTPPPGGRPSLASPVTASSRRAPSRSDGAAPTGALLVRPHPKGRWRGRRAAGRRTSARPWPGSQAEPSQACLPASKKGTAEPPWPLRGSARRGEGGGEGGGPGARPSLRPRDAPEGPATWRAQRNGGRHVARRIAPSRAHTHPTHSWSLIRMPSFPPPPPAPPRAFRDG